jgi:hypothetical protein
MTTQHTPPESVNDIRRGRTWDYICALEQQRAELLAALREIARTAPNLATVLRATARAALAKAKRQS